MQGLPYLTQLRCNADRLLLAVVGVLTLLAAALAPWHQTWPEVLAIGAPTAAVVVWRVLAHPGSLLTRCVVAAALMVFTALHIHQARGMIEPNFGVFVLLAFLLLYQDWIPIVVAAGVIAVHHLVFDWLQRNGAPIWTVERAGAADASLAVAMDRMRQALQETTAHATGALQGIAQGDLSQQVADDGSAIDVSLNAASDTLRNVVREVSSVLDGIAQSDLSRRVSVDAPGEFARLREHVNSTADFLARFNRNQSALIRSANAGDFSGRIESAGLSGYQLELAADINDPMRSFDGFVDQFGSIMSSFARGDFEGRINTAAAGRIEQLRRDTNETAARLSSIVGRIRAASAEIQAAAESVAASNGEMSSRSLDQSRAVESTSGAPEEITSTVRHNTDRTRNADELARATAQVATSGRGIVAEIANASAEQSKALDALAGAMNQIDGTTKGIAGIVSDADNAAGSLRLQADSLNEAIRQLSAPQRSQAGRRGAGAAEAAA